jgi:hypothetical protein
MNAAQSHIEPKGTSIKQVEALAKTWMVWAAF